jgi:hypothetical protein
LRYARGRRDTRYDQPSIVSIGKERDRRAGL